MSNVTNILEHQPHMTGEAKCLACGHEWVAVAPIGTVAFECPKCGLDKGQTKYPCQPPEGSDIWECNCGSQTFFIRPTGFMCTNCGVSEGYDVL